MEYCDMKTCQPFGLATLTKELKACLKVLNQSRTCIYKHQFENIIKLSKYRTNTIINKAKECENSDERLMSKKDLKRDIFQTEIDAEQMLIRIDHIRNEWLQQQHTLSELNDSYYRKCELLSAHNYYYAIQGSVLCSMLLSLLDEANAQQIFLEGDELFLDFILISGQFLRSFVKSHSVEPPVEDTCDFKFITSLYLCSAKMSWNSRALAVIVENEKGQTFISNLIRSIRQIDHSTLQNLKLLIWTILHNVSGDDDGKLLLQQYNDFLIALGNVLNEDYQPKLFQYVLEILERLSKDMPSERYLNDFETNIKLQKLTELSNSEFKGINAIPNKILRNIGKAANTFLESNNFGKNPNQGSPRVSILDDQSTSKAANSCASCDKRAHISSAPNCGVRKKKHKRTCKRKKYRKMKTAFSQVSSEDVPFRARSSVTIPTPSNWKRKKSLLSNKKRSSKTGTLNNDKLKKSSLVTKNSAISVHSFSVDDLLENELCEISLVSSEISEDEDEFSLEDELDLIDYDRLLPIKYVCQKKAKPSVKLRNKVVRSNIRNIKTYISKFKFRK